MLRCAISALSMLRTVCLGETSAVVSTWISSTAPVSLATMRTDTTPGSVANSSSARLMGSTLPAIGLASGECVAGAFAAIRLGYELSGATTGMMPRRERREAADQQDRSRTTATGVFGTGQYEIQGSRNQGATSSGTLYSLNFR